VLILILILLYKFFFLYIKQRYLDKHIFIQLNGNRKITGVLRGMHFFKKYIYNLYKNGNTINRIIINFFFYLYFNKIINQQFNIL